MKNWFNTVVKLGERIGRISGSQQEKQIDAVFHQFLQAFRKAV
ncbi:MAG: hypothetical protein QM739_12585 [Propionivibrio sp.]